MDVLSPAAARGDILFRNATTMARLSAATAGFLLMTNGAGADPSWQGFVQPVGSSPVARAWQSKAADFVSVLDFGAIGDGDIANAAANATALTNALATGKRVRVPYTAAGYHFGTNQIAVGAGQVVEGENQVLLKSTANTSAFRMTGTNAYSGVHNVSIDMTGSGAASTAIRFGTSSGSINRVRLGKLRFTNCVEAIGDEASASNVISDVLVADCLCQSTRGRQVYNRRSAGFVVFRDFIIDHTQNGSLVSFESARFEDFAGLELSRFDALGYGAGTPAYNAAAIAIVLAGNAVTAAALWLDRVFADTVIGDGILVQKVQYFFGHCIKSSLSRGHALTLNQVTNATLTNSIANGSTGQTGAAAGAGGLRVLNSSDVAVSNLLAVNNTGVGLDINASTRTTVAGLVSKANSFGLAIQGTAASNVVSGGVMSGNGTAVSNAATGAGNVVKDIAGYNPVGAAAVTTAASPWTYTAGSSPETLYLSASTGVSAVTQGAFRCSRQPLRPMSPSERNSARMRQLSSPIRAPSQPRRWCTDGCAEWGQVVPRGRHIAPAPLQFP